ncbi:hypothetical protein MBLNU459_g4705t1 [Dothideomycetes sp. NU459]
MADSTLEPFPSVAAPSRKQPSSSANGRVRPRRKSSSLGGEPRGDTGAAAFATLPPSAAAHKFSSGSASVGRSASDRGPGRKRRKARSLLMSYVRLSLRHTWLTPLILVLLGVALYAVNPSTSNPFHACIFLSYPIPRSPTDSPDTPLQYAKGRADFAFVAFYMAFFSFTREFLMQRMIRPLAFRLGVKSRAKQARFMEQFYTAIYFAIFGPFGLYVMSRTPTWYFNTTAMFEGFPHRSHEGLFKAYYLLQASYWAQQALVLMLMLEKPRKDFKELVLHHVVTLALIWLSYRFHFGYMGIAVYITHDISDFFLATSKCLNYVNSPVTAPYFVVFIGVWTYLRHYLNLRILYAVLTEFRTVGPFELNWETQQYKCWISQIVTFSLLAALQAVNLFWFVLIMRILWRFISTPVLADERSEDEDEDEDEEVEAVQPKAAAAVSANDNPSLLLNGEPVAVAEAKASGAEAAAAAAARSRRRG